MKTVLLFLHSALLFIIYYLRQYALRRRYLIAALVIDPYGGAQRAGKGLETRFDDMVRVFAIDHTHMQSDTGFSYERLQELLKKLGVHCSDGAVRQSYIETQVAPAGDVYSAEYQRLIHGKGNVAVTADTASVAQRLRERRPEANPDVLDGMVAVHMRIAIAFNVEVKSAVPGKKLKHMVKKTNACINSVFTGAVEAQRQRNIRFGSLARKLTLSHNSHKSSHIV